MNSMSIVQSPTIMPHEERYKVIGYADDVKPWRSSWWWTRPWLSLRVPQGENCTETQQIRNVNFSHLPGGVEPWFRKTYPVIT